MSVAERAAREVEEDIFERGVAGGGGADVEVPGVEPGEDGGDIAADVVDFEGEGGAVEMGEADAGEGGQLFEPAIAADVGQLDLKPVAIGEEAAEAREGVVGDDPAVVHDGDAVAESFDFFHVVSRVDEGLTAGLEGLKGVEDGVAALGVNADGGLIKDEQVGVVEEGCTDVEPALHTATEAGDGFAGAVGEAGKAEGCVDALAEGVAAETIEGAKETEVADRIQLLVEGQVLGDVADALFDGTGVASDLLAVDEDLAGIGANDAADHGDGGGLSGAVGAEEAETLSFGDGEADVVDGEKVSVLFAEVGDGEHERMISGASQTRLRCGTPPPR